VAVQVIERVVEKQVVQTTPPTETVEDDTEDEVIETGAVVIRKGEIPDPSVTKEEITKKWGEVRKLIKQYDPILDATLNHAKLVDVRNGVLYLGFPRETIKNKLQGERKSVLWTSAAISKVLGKPVGVSLTTLGKRGTFAGGSASLVDAALQMGGKLVVDKQKDSPE